MYESPPAEPAKAEHGKRSTGLIGAFAVTLGGAIVAFIVISIIGLILRFVLGLQFVGLLSPLYEEPLKAIGLFVLALFFPGTFKSKKDGALLGALAGLFFGLFEIYDFSILYQSMINAGLLSAGVANAYLVSRIFTSLPMHVISSLLFGLGIAFAAMSSARPRLRDIFSGNALTFLILSVGFHLIYNIFNIVPALLTRIDFVGIVFGFLVMLAGLYVTYRLYEYIPDKLEILPAMGPKELLSKALGREARRGEPAKVP